jgi:hypothetical protein
LLVEGQPSPGLFVIRAGKVLVRPSTTLAAEAERNRGGSTSPRVRRGRSRRESLEAMFDEFSDSLSPGANAKNPLANGAESTTMDIAGEAIVAEKFPGDYFGEKELRAGVAASHTVEGGSDGGLLLWLSAEDFQDLLADQPGLPWRDHRGTTADGASPVKLAEAASAL